MPQNSLPSLIPGMIFRDPRPLIGFLSSLSLLVTLPGLAEEPAKVVPQTSQVAINSVPMPTKDKASDYEMYAVDASLLLETADKLAANTTLRVDRIVNGRTLLMMEKLRRINDAKMSAATKIASNLGASRGGGMPAPSGEALAMAKNRPRAGR